MNENNIDTRYYSDKALELTSEGKTIIYFANKKELIGIISVADTIKENSKKAVNEFKKRKIEVLMITGDNKAVAESIGGQVGIENVISDVMPEDKEKEVEKLQKLGKKVAFVGDGINDSPALTKADIGIAIGSGTDIAIDSAEVVLINNDLNDVITAMDLSKKTINNIKTSLFWAFFYNIIGIPVACGILYPIFGIKLTPMFGAGAMSLSSICVVTNALRLMSFKRKKNKEEKNMKTIWIEGMMCENCKKHVEKALNSIEGITNVNVSLDNKNAVIEYSKEIDDEILKNVISDAGYEVKEIE